MARLERSSQGFEVRSEGRRLTGTVLKYGDVSPSHRERFQPGAFRMAPAVVLNMGHDVEKALAYAPGGGLTLTDTPEALTMRAELPPTAAADRALEEVRSGKANGLSIEFRALAERREAGLRIVTAAELSGVGLVRNPSYGASRVEARRSRFLRAKIPNGVALPCSCLGKGCKYASFTNAALAEIAREMNEMLDRAYSQALENIENSRAADVLLISGRGMENAIASARRGTLTARIGDDGALELEAFSEAGTPRALSEMAAGAPVFVRPIVDEAASKFAEKGETRTYDQAVIRAFLAKPLAGEIGAWPEAEVQPAERAARPRERRRIWL